MQMLPTKRGNRGFGVGAFQKAQQYFSPKTQN
jgi:hypothetical protein